MKAPHRVQYYKQHLLPEPVPARWGTWIESVTFYSELSEAVKSILAKFSSDLSVSTRESQSACSDPEVAYSISYIRSSFAWLPESIKRLGAQGLPL
jgi:hypothetical protein